MPGNREGSPCLASKMSRAPCSYPASCRCRSRSSDRVEATTARSAASCRTCSSTAAYSASMSAHSDRRCAMRVWMDSYRSRRAARADARSPAVARSCDAVCASAASLALIPPSWSVSAASRASSRVRSCWVRDRDLSRSVTSTRSAPARSSVSAYVRTAAAWASSVARNCSRRSSRREASVSLLAQRPQSLVHLGVLALQPLQILRQPLPLAGGRPQPFLQDLHRRLPTREVLDELQQGALGIFPQPRHLDGARAIMIDLAADLGRRRRGRLQLLANGVCLRGDALQVCDDATGVVYLQGQLKGPNLTGMGLVSCRSLRLRPELLQLRRELCQDVGDPQEVGGRVPQAALRLTAPPLVARQARSLLQELPALFRTGVEHAVDLALSNQRVRPAAQPRPQE